MQLSKKRGRKVAKYSGPEGANASKAPEHQDSVINSILTYTSI